MAPRFRARRAAGETLVATPRMTQDQIVADRARSRRAWRGLRNVHVLDRIVVVDRLVAAAVGRLVRRAQRIHRVRRARSAARPFRLRPRCRIRGRRSACDASRRTSRRSPHMHAWRPIPASPRQPLPACQGHRRRRQCQFGVSLSKSESRRLTPPGAVLRDGACPTPCPRHARAARSAPESGSRTPWSRRPPLP